MPEAHKIKVRGQHSMLLSCLYWKKHQTVMSNTKVPIIFFQTTDLLSLGRGSSFPKCLSCILGAKIVTSISYS